MPRADILLVDDQPANLLALEAVLDDVGDDLVRAASGEEALRLLAGRDFAVVLLDVQMPGLDGFETAKLIRGADRSRHTPIIFLTAAERDEFPVAEAYPLGAVDYLVKPLVPDVLRAKVAVFVELFRNRPSGCGAGAAGAGAGGGGPAGERAAVRPVHAAPARAWPGSRTRTGRYVYANDAAERAFGTAAGRTLRQDRRGGLPARRPPPSSGRTTGGRSPARAGVQAVETLEHADGVVHHSLVSKFPIPGPDGRPALVGGMAIDVTAAEAGRRRPAVPGRGRRRCWPSSLDYETTLAAVARLVVPRLADWCSVYVTDRRPAPAAGRRPRRPGEGGLGARNSSPATRPTRTSPAASRR